MDEIFNMDCVTGMREKLADGSVDLTVTSPPYDNLRKYQGFEWDFEATARELWRVTKDGGVVVWIVNDQTLNYSESGTSFRQALGFMDIGFKLFDTMIWEKRGTGACGSKLGYLQNFEYMFVLSKGKPKALNLIRDRKNNYSGPQVRKGHRDTRTVDCERGRYYDEFITYEPSEYGKRFNVWNIDQSADRGLRNQHPASFPIQLAHDHIVSWSNVGDVVLDPFMGSGTTAKAAIELGRHFVGFEISDRYCALAQQRIAGTQRVIEGEVLH